MRQKGSRNKLITIDYDVIGDLVGIAGDTAKRYAHRGKYDPRDLESVLTWVNERRAARGQSLLGLPSERVSNADSVKQSVHLPAPNRNNLLYYDPGTACYRSDESLGSTAFRP